MDTIYHQICHWLNRGGRALLPTLAACGLILATPVAAEAATTYTFGVVPQFQQRKLFAIWKPIVDELSRRTGLEIQLVTTLSVPDFEVALKKGSYDFVYANPYHILRVSDSQGYIPLVRDQQPLRGILVVRKDSPLTSVKELAGKSLAIPSPNALGASLLLQADLSRLYKLEMRMVNARNHSSAYLHALNGLTDAAGGVEKTLAEQDAKVIDGLRVLYTTQAMPSHPVAAHPRLRPEIRETMKKAFLEMSATPAGKQLLDEVPMSSPTNATLDDYLVMRQWGLERYWVGEGK